LATKSERQILKKIAIIGATGFLGSALCRELNHLGVIPIDRSIFDINSSIDLLKNILIAAKADYVIQAAALLRPQAERLAEQTVYDVNAHFPQKLAKVCKSLNIPMLHFSTDTVFDGSMGRYLETDRCSATDIYGKSKALGDQAECMIIRMSLLGNMEQSGSFLQWLNLNKGKTIEGFVNRPWNGVSVKTVTRIVSDIVVNNLYEIGVNHIHSPNSVSRYELIQLLDQKYRFHLTVVPSEAADKMDRTLCSTKQLTRLVKSIEEQYWGENAF
jgi:dTDP-4-dehydrorhamnose reductase